MDILTLQNFYKDSVKVAWTAGAGNFYVNTKPVPTSGILVVNPSSASKREIIRYSAVGTDGTGDYITVSTVADRGLGGTTAQTHAVDEPVRMNITAEHWDNIQEALDQVGSDLAVAILAGAAFATTAIAGLLRSSYSPDSSLGTATISVASPAVITKATHGLTVNDKVKFTTTGALPTGIVASTEYYVISAGLAAGSFRISATLGGTAINTSGTQSGVHTLIKTTPVALADTDPRVLTTVEKARIPSIDEDAALAGGGDYGTPSASNKFITQNYNSSPTGLPVVRTYTTASSDIGSSTTQFDITNPAGTTFRYTWDGVGTDPVLSLANNPIGSLINFKAQNFTAANNGVFLITGAGANYVEVTNASGVAESNKTIGTGYVTKSGTTGWTKPLNLKYIIVEEVGGGGDGATGTDGGTSGGGGGGGGGGAYSKKLILTSSLLSTEYYLVGAKNRRSQFGVHLIALNGDNGTSSSNSGAGGDGGTASGGDLNIDGGDGAPGVYESTTSSNTGTGGNGGSSMLGKGGKGGKSANGSAGNQYGGGGGGGPGDGNSASSGGVGAQGIIIITEYFS